MHHDSRREKNRWRCIPLTAILTASWMDSGQQSPPSQPLRGSSICRMSVVRRPHRRAQALTQWFLLSTRRYYTPVDVFYQARGSGIPGLLNETSNTTFATMTCFSLHFVTLPMKSVTTYSPIWQPPTPPPVNTHHRHLAVSPSSPREHVKKFAKCNVEVHTSAHVKMKTKHPGIQKRKPERSKIGNSPLMIVKIADPQSVENAEKTSGSPSRNPYGASPGSSAIILHDGRNNQPDRGGIPSFQQGPLGQTFSTIMEGEQLLPRFALPCIPLELRLHSKIRSILVEVRRSDLTLAQDMSMIGKENK
ncbi:hypothetical protein BKA93DRAFT_749844 [Sparassis latifolia]